MKASIWKQQQYNGITTNKMPMEEKRKKKIRKERTSG